ncbi:cyclase [Flammeovirgaceae bacterium 311]|nr:cyclase [Flammeovirgaceae bacterium 311]
MTTEQSRKLIQEYAEAISKDKSDAILDKYMNDDELKGHIIIFETGLPNYQLVAKDIVAEGNKVVVRGTVEGEHKGDLFGVPPTGKKVKVDGLIMYELADNKIVNHWMQFDTVALMQQIGAMPVPANEH